VLLPRRKRAKTNGEANEEAPVEIRLPRPANGKVAYTLRNCMGYPDGANVPVFLRALLTCDGGMTQLKSM
jgi:hypothetical protein